MAAIRHPIPRSIAILSENIKFEHTIFALLFAYLGSLLAADGFPSLGVFFWFPVAMAASTQVAVLPRPGDYGRLLAWEHSLVKPDDLSKINLAFFNINGYIAIVLFATTLASLYV